MRGAVEQAAKSAVKRTDGEPSRPPGKAPLAMEASSKGDLHTAKILIGANMECVPHHDMSCAAWFAKAGSMSDKWSFLLACLVF